MEAAFFLCRNQLPKALCSNLLLEGPKVNRFNKILYNLAFLFRYLLGMETSLPIFVFIWMGPDCKSNLNEFADLYMNCNITLPITLTFHIFAFGFPVTTGIS